MVVYYVLCYKIVSLATYTIYTLFLRRSVVQDVMLKCIGVLAILCAVVSFIDELE